MMQTEILPVACRVAPEFAAHLAVESLLKNREMIRNITKVDFPARSEKTKQRFAETTATVGNVMWLAIARMEWSGSAGSIFLDRPNVLSRHRSLIVKGTEIVVQDATDIVANELGVDLARLDAFATRVEQGVLDTNLEALVHISSPTGNVGQAYAVSRDWSRIASSQRTEAESLALSPEIQRKIAEDLDRGFTVVVPRSPSDGFVGWWRIDPGSGDTLGVDVNGWGSSTEDSLLLRMAIEASRGFLFEYCLCQAIPQTINMWRLFNHDYLGGWHPSWTKPVPKGRDAGEIWDENNNVCLIQAIAMGFVATLPLLIMTVQQSRTMRLLQLEKAERIVADALDKAGVGVGKVRVYQVTIHQHGGVTVTFAGSPKTIESVASRIELPENFSVAKSSRPGFQGGGATYPDGRPYPGKSDTCCEPRMAQGIREINDPVVIEGPPVWRGDLEWESKGANPRPNEHPSTDRQWDWDPTRMDPCPSCRKNAPRM